MILIVLVLLTLSNTDDITATAENLEMTPRSLETVSAMNKVNPAPEDVSSWIESRSKRNSLKMDKLDGTMNEKADLSNRKSKILKSLAFIAGLDAGDLAGAASSHTKTYTKFPTLALNIGASRISPQIAAFYDMTNPYVFATPLTFYSLWDPLRLQPINGIPHTLQQLPQNQVLNLLDDNKSTDPLNSDNEYVDEAKKVENVKTASNTNENNRKNTEFQVEDDRNAEEKVISTDTACNTRNEGKPKQVTAGKSVSKDRENVDGSLTAAGLRAANTAGQNPAIDKTNQNATRINGTVPTNDSNTTETAPYSYYGGYPQSINHIDLTTDTYQHKYHEYEHINYNLPTYDRPVNFYSNDRFNNYPVPPVDPYPPGQFRQEQNPEYFSNDFRRFAYPTDNTAPFVRNDFRPVV